MLILGIETSCDDTAMSVLEVDKKEKKRILANIVSSQIKLHAKYGGVFPALAAREHAKNIGKVLKLTLKEAGLKSVGETDLIAVTAGPGLAVALIVGITFAKTLAWKYKKPIVGVNHLEGHIYSNWLPNLKPTFPALNLIVSGGHTELVLMRGHGKYKLIGETLDDAAGEAFDKIARLLGLGYPGGPLISLEAERFSKSGIPPTLDPRLIAQEFSSGCISELP
ncbi:MAG: tRNA (adenosine(37)-N6)-threonylcarbamoyltransferase complex transferase subunit TsaD, partial [bacterium]|nr:tRNA (adenosine(37)-N6)-threonylcarbamoyltransferase complex transferase subunit TsaD [bacterium]